MCVCLSVCLSVCLTHILSDVISLMLKGRYEWLWHDTGQIIITRDFMIDTYHISHKVYYTDPELGILMAYIDIQLHNGVLNVTRNTTNVVKASLWHGQNIL